MINFCDFPNIVGLVSLCTGELLALASNMYLIVLTVVVVVFSRSQKVRVNLWSLHRMAWVLIAINSVFTLVSSICWLVLVKTESVVIMQVLNILSLICLPLTFHLLEQHFNTRFILTMTFYCLISAVSKMLVVASFSRKAWVAVSGLDIRLICATIQSICLLLLIFLTIYNFWSNFKKDFEELPSEDQGSRSGASRLTFLSKILYGWCMELLIKGKRQVLHVSDCITVLPQPDFTTFEDIDLRNHKASSLSLLLLLLHRRLGNMVVAGVLLLVVIGLEFVPLYVSYGVIRNLQSNYTQNQDLFTMRDFPNNAYSLLSLFLICECVRCVLYQYHITLTSEFAAETHYQMQSLLYAKLKKTAQWELTAENNLSNLMTVDIDRITTGLLVLHQLWRIPVQCTACILILETLVGFSCLVPIVILLTCVILITLLLHHRTKQETLLQTHKQHWFYLIKEFIEHIWILKIDNWQTLFKSKILKTHRLVSERRVMTLFSAVQMLKHMIPVVMVTSLFGVYYVGRGSSGNLTPQAGVVTILLLCMLRNLLTLAQTISKNVLDMLQSSADVISFLNRDQTEPSKMEEENHYMADESPITASISNGTFTWGTQRMSPKVLSNVNIQIPKGHLTLIIGKPEAGKTSLVSALLSEMNCIVGEVSWAGDKDIAVAAQYPVIFGGTVQDNVLFGTDYDAERYLKIITLCNLVHHTININESKTNSLHQISLARALYSPASTIILDDPLAGLNPDSREQFFFESIVLFAGEEHRTVVMTTTDPELLEHAHQVILLDEGKVVYQGPAADSTLREHPVLAELATANVRSLPPPVPHRRRFDNKPADTNEVHVKNIPSAAYKEWLQSSSGLNLAISLISLSCMVFLNATMYWLLLSWISRDVTKPTRLVTLSPNVVTQAPGYNFSVTTVKTSAFPFLCSGGGVILLQMLTVLLVNSVVQSANSTLLRDMLHSVATVCLYAYNKTPVNAVLSRFTVDLELIGRPLMECLGAVLFLTSETVATIIVQVICSPGSLVVLVPLTISVIWMYLLYSPTSRVLRILQTEFKQNIYKHIAETISCITLIRGYNVTERYKERLRTHTTKLYHINVVISGTSRWLSLYQDMTVNFITFGCFIATCLVAQQGNIEMSALSFLLLLISTQQLRLIWNYLESCDIILSSIDNCTNYAYHVPREIETPRFKPPKGWPQTGAISIKDVFASLSPDQEPILRNINLDIPAGTKLGVSSVQGGGKEFIVPLLFRSLYVNNGSVKIDDWDTSSLSLEDLRAHISFISSDPPLYNGSVRYNIDPEGKQEDHDIWKVLEKVHLHEKIADLAKNLDSEDFSLNRQERQLLNLAKVLLNPSNIVVVEESKFITSVDLFNKFYEVLDAELATKTRIIIGRRSVTLETCEKLLFLDQGRLVSFGDKADLESRNCSYYKQLNRASVRFSRLPSAASES